jgi:hypothetical protein
VRSAQLLLTYKDTRSDVCMGFSGIIQCEMPGAQAASGLTPTGTSIPRFLRGSQREDGRTTVISVSLIFELAINRKEV